MKRYTEVNKKQENDFEDDGVIRDIASSTECTGMIPTPPLTDEEVDNYNDIFSVTQQSAHNAKSNIIISQAEKRSTVISDKKHQQ